MSTLLVTPRLELVGCSPELLRAEGDDRARFGHLLDARIPGDWPPELYDDDARLWTLRAVEGAPEHEGWWMYYLVLREDRELAGVAGYKGPPAEDGTVEVGYGVMPDHRRRGLATEATRALVERAFAFPRVTRVVAETFPHLEPSIGVLRNLGFTLEGPGSEEGVIRFQLPREDWPG
ncbi:GNAT family N-acetyltransferase [Longimicrobium sp.]|uniref:GNAT family N-acetyltransferase n=1 Tax=Longimicrobium sp. TaxID=2029185 RepID=UPI002C9B6CFA|nr:GNAT family N-acetyltransferase [Longimicrobium sp.]HSU14805.1 GNAT family N-acetyltransferase [Longimicrobium sp.]